MRLFEVDLGAARNVLAVLQGRADKSGQHATLPFPVVMNILRPLGLGISTPDGLIALKNAVDPAGDVIADIKDDGTIILKTKQSAPDQSSALTKGAAPSLDQMARSGSKKLSPDL